MTIRYFLKVEKKLKNEIISTQLQIATANNVFRLMGKEYKEKCEIIENEIESTNRKLRLVSENASASESIKKIESLIKLYGCVWRN